MRALTRLIERQVMNTKVRYYTVTVAHDRGKATIRVPASSALDAVEIILKAEKCPPCAILGVREFNGKIPASWGAI